ncbi:MAG: DUF5717 family protein, partial [Defluviitaleaceae bacterium]|nr:DUF5717 family protein [Defluviitaleaceae bacterium]
MLDYNQQITRLENKLLKKNTIPTATLLTLRYWQASRFADDAGQANTLIQRANHVALTTHRQNAANTSIMTLAIFIAIEAGHYESAAGMLDKAMGYKSFLRANAPGPYTRLCFLYAYLELVQGRTRQAKKHWRAFNEAGTPTADFTTMQGLLHLAAGEFTEAFHHLRDAFRSGSHSAFLYEGLYRYYRTTPHQPESGMVLAALLYAAGRGVDITGIARRHQDALLAAASKNPDAARQLYNISGYLPLLAGICAHHIARGDVSAAAFAYYQTAESKQIFVPGLLKQLVYTGYANHATHLSRQALAQFLETENMTPVLGVYVYHLLLTTPGLEDLAAANHSQIMTQAEKCLAANVAGREANSLYYYLWRQGERSAALEEVLSQNLTVFEVTAPPHSAVAHIYMTQPEKRGMTVYDMPGDHNTLQVEAATHRFAYTCFAAGKRTILDQKLTVRRMIPGVDASLYRHFFDQGDRRFYVLVYLANTYLQNPASDAIPVFEAILAEKVITKAYKTRVLAALGQLYFKEARYEQALACYDQMDEDVLETAFIEQILRIYMQTKEWERAAALIGKNHSGMSAELLQEAIVVLLFTSIDHALLAEAAYTLLMDGFFSQPLLDLVLENYRAGYQEWTALAAVLDEKG